MKRERKKNLNFILPNWESIPGVVRKTNNDIKYSNDLCENRVTGSVNLDADWPVRTRDCPLRKWAALAVYKELRGTVCVRFPDDGYRQNASQRGANFCLFAHIYL